METIDAVIGREVRCDFCGCAFAPEILTEMDGEIAFSFFRCDYCGKAYMVSVTDVELRNNIAKYLFLASQYQGRQLSEEENRTMQELKASNVARARELRRLYLKEDSHDRG